MKVGEKHRSAASVGGESGEDNLKTKPRSQRAEAALAPTVASAARKKSQSRTGRSRGDAAVGKIREEWGHCQNWGLGVEKESRGNEKGRKEKIAESPPHEGWPSERIKRA